MARPDRPRGPSPLLLVLAAAAALVAFSTPVHAAVGLMRYGPVAEASGNFPDFYVDNAGLGLQLCIPQSAADIAAGVCLLAPGNANPPESLAAGNFGPEHFYWATTFTLALPNGGTAALTLALEGAFATRAAQDGQQVVFARTRVAIDTPPGTGTYTITHPFGTLTMSVGGRRGVFTDDVGAACTGTDPARFACALAAPWSFLEPSETPGGAPRPRYVTADGRTFLSNPASLPAGTPVTGSPTGNNLFRVEGPGLPVGGLETTVADLVVGELVAAGTTGPELTAQRAAYARSAAPGGAAQVDVLGRVVVPPPVGAATTAPGAAAAPPPPQLVASAATVTAPLATRLLQGGAVPIYAFLGALELPSGLPTGAAPRTVDVIIDGGAPTTVPLVDAVTITKAVYDVAARTLEVRALSSDELEPPTLTLELPAGYTDTAAYALVGGAVTVQNVDAAPDHIAVSSSAGGHESAFRVTVLHAGGNVVALFPPPMPPPPCPICAPPTTCPPPTECPPLPTCPPPTECPPPVTTPPTCVPPTCVPPTECPPPTSPTTCPPPTECPPPATPPTCPPPVECALPTPPTTCPPPTECPPPPTTTPCPPPTVCPPPTTPAPTPAPTGAPTPAPLAPVAPPPPTPLGPISTGFESAPSVFTGGAHLGAVAVFNTESAAAARTGAFGASATITRAGSVNWHLQYTSVPQAFAAGKYSFSAWVRATPAASVELALLQDGTGASPASISFPATSTFQLITLPGITLASSGSYRLNLDFGTARAGTVIDLDDVAVVADAAAPAPPPTPATPSPTTPAPAPTLTPASVATTLRVYEQCGGLSNCPSSVAASAAGCSDAPYASYVCASGSVCLRQSAWYWQCVPAAV